MTARGTLERREMVLLVIRAPSGARGLGEAVPLSLRGGTGLAAVRAEIDDWSRRAVIDDEVALPADPAARCAVVTALADVKSRELSLPLCGLLQPGTPLGPVRCNATLTTAEPSAVADQAADWHEDGFEALKLKCGPGNAVAQVESVRAELGDSVRIRLDFNGTLELDDAVRVLEELEPHGIELAEQPVGDLESMAVLRRRTGIPIVADESVASPSDAGQARDLEACEAATVKLSKTGDLDASLGGLLPTYLSSALDGPVGIAAAAHAALALQAKGGAWSQTHGLATQRLFDATIASTGWDLDGDLLVPGGGSGLGVEIDDAALARHRL
jgi:L-Ala-D/L-Glu epimerase